MAGVVDNPHYYRARYSLTNRFFGSRYNKIWPIKIRFCFLNAYAIVSSTATQNKATTWDLLRIVEFLYRKVQIKTQTFGSGQGGTTKGVPGRIFCGLKTGYPRLAAVACGFVLCGMRVFYLCFYPLCHAVVFVGITNKIRGGFYLPVCIFHRHAHIASGKKGQVI